MCQASHSWERERQGAERDLKTRKRKEKKDLSVGMDLPSTSTELCSSGLNPEAAVMLLALSLAPAVPQNLVFFKNSPATCALANLAPG